MSEKRVILSDSSLNRYGYRVLTAGLLIEAFEKNPVMLWAHFRDEGSPIWGNYQPIGYWKDIRIEGDELSAIPVFDDACELSRTIHAKYDAGTIRAASIGISILATSSETEHLLPGQTRETVVKAEVREASLVDIPANANAVRLYDSNTSVRLSAGDYQEVVPVIKKQLNENRMKLKETWEALLSFLKVDKSSIATAELSVENLESVNAELARLSSENTSLVNAKNEVDKKLNEKDTEINTLKNDVSSKDTELSALKDEISTKGNEISALKIQVENLKKNPAGKGAIIIPEADLNAGANDDDFVTFATEHAGDTLAIANEMEKRGLI